MANWYYRQLARAEPARGGYQVAEPWGRSWFSADGRDALLADGRALERWCEHLAALRDLWYIAHCSEHVAPTDGLEWLVNDYDCDPVRDPEHIEFILWGWHEPESCERPCVAARVHTTPAGLVLWDLR